jgi:hypothetical protein
MFNVKKKTVRFDVGKTQDLEAYDAILNNPACTIIREIKEKLTEKEIGDEGQITSFKEYLILIVTYQTAEIME